MKKILLLFFSFVIVFISVFLLFNIRIHAESFTYNKDIYENSNELYVNGNENEKFCDSMGNNYIIDDYHKSLFASNIAGSKIEKKYNVLDDDPIVNIIPRYYFNHECEYYSDGKEYFFYIVTSKRNGYLNNLVGSKEGNYYISEVLYVNYKTSLKEKQSIEFLKNEMNDKNPDSFSYVLDVHQFRFFTVDVCKEGAYLPSMLSVLSVSFSSRLINKDVVIPLPTNYPNEYKFEESDFHYEINNIACNASIKNMHTTNDNRGLFFIESLISDTVTKYSDSLKTEIDDDHRLDILMDIFSLFGGKISNAITAIKIIYELASDMGWLATTQPYDPLVVTAADIIDQNITTLQTSKSEQVRDGGLIKNFITARKDLCIKKDSYAEFIYRYSYDTTDENVLGALIDTDLAYDVCFDGNKKISVMHNFKSLVSNEEFFETISENSIIKGYNYKLTSNKYLFVPSSTSIYDFSVDNSQIINISKNGTKIRTNSKLNKGEEYIIEVINDTNISTSYELKVNTIESLSEVINVDIVEDDNNIYLNLQFKNLNKYEVIVLDYGTFNVLDDGTCIISLDKKQIYNKMDYFGIIPNIYINSETYERITVTLDDNINLYIRNQNYIKNHNKEIMTSITKTNGFYNINTEIQFLALFFNHEENTWISFDDGINNDSYIIGDSQNFMISINRNLDFENLTFEIPHKVYLYGIIDGNNHTLCNLILDSSYEFFYIENYGCIKNIGFKNVKMKAIFEYGSTYGIYQNVEVH